MDDLWAQKEASSWQPVWKAGSYLHRGEMNSSNNHKSVEQEPKLPLRRGIPYLQGEEFSLIETLIMGATLTEGTHTRVKHICVHAQSSLTLWSLRTWVSFIGRRIPYYLSCLQNVCVCMCMYWSTLDSWVRKIPWRREWKCTPVFLPGESDGQRSLAGYSPWGRKESDRTEQLTLPLSYIYKIIPSPLVAKHRSQSWLL